MRRQLWEVSAGLWILSSSKQLALKMSYLEGRRHLPIVELTAAG
jgi:hypothetical protein